MPQAFYNKEAGISKIATETAAGQWGSALAFAGAMFGLEVLIFMVRVSYNQKPYRRGIMETFGARCIPSRSDQTCFGGQVLSATSDSNRSLGIAISEAVEVAAGAADTQLRARVRAQSCPAAPDRDRPGSHRAEEMAGDYLDIVVGCTGGGSNFAGIAFPFIGAAAPWWRQRPRYRRRAGSVPQPHPGRYAYDFGDTGKMTPLAKMHTLGSAFMPPGFHAGG